MRCPWFLLPLLHPPGGIWLSGLIAGPLLLVGGLAATVRFWPDWPIIKTAARILENLEPHLILAALACTGLLWLIRAPRGVVWLSAGLTLFAIGVFVTDHLRRAQPMAPGARPELTVLWFNMLSNNPLPPAKLARALGESGADVVLLGEPVPLMADLALLDEWFPVRVGCTPDSRCEFLALARAANVAIQLKEIGRTHETRLALVEIPGPDGQIRRIVGLHLFKPWFDGIVESETWNTLDAMRQLDGPLIAIGDLNAAPWSSRGRMLADRCELRPLRLPPPSWPVAAGWAGLPIDNLLTRDVRIVSAERWGVEMGSNHAGILAQLSFDGADWDASSPADCRPDWSPGRETPLQRARRAQKLKVDAATGPGARP